MADAIEAWESLKETIPSNHAEAAEKLWDAGDALADEVERLRSEREKARQDLSQCAERYAVLKDKNTDKYKRIFELKDERDRLLDELATAKVEIANLKATNEWLRPCEARQREARLRDALKELGDLNNWNSNRNMWVRPDDPIAIARAALEGAA